MGSKGIPRPKGEGGAKRQVRGEEILDRHTAHCGYRCPVVLRQYPSKAKSVGSEPTID